MDKSELSILMAKIKSGRDEIAFSKLFDFLAPKINSYFVQNRLSKENAEELTQEVMSNIWSKSNTYDSSKSAVSTWVFTIARNKKVDFFRKNNKIDTSEDDIREFMYENVRNDDFKSSEINDQVQKIKDELDDKQQQIIKMNFFENKSHKKIAEELEIPLGTVKSRIRNILVKMQKYL